MILGAFIKVIKKKRREFWIYSSGKSQKLPIFWAARSWMLKFCFKKSSSKNERQLINVIYEYHLNWVLWWLDGRYFLKCRFQVSEFYSIHGCVKSTVIERRQYQLGRMADIPPPVTFSVFDFAVPAFAQYCIVNTLCIY